MSGGRYAKSRKGKRGGVFTVRNVKRDFVKSEKRTIGVKTKGMAIATENDLGIPLDDDEMDRMYQRQLSDY